MINSFWYQSKNVGDTLTPIVVEHFTGQKVKYVNRNVTGKLIAIGSIMKALRCGDVVWGAGVMRNYDKFMIAQKCKVLAVRGKLTEQILKVKCGVYGDPALLLPLIYNPKVEKKYKVGIIPHYVEKDEPVFRQMAKMGNHMIDVEQDWKSFVNEILECESIISSSLHGIVIAEAYGIEAGWIKPSGKVLGDGFKFRDYLTGTGREEQGIGMFPPIKNLKEIQDKLINALKKHYG